MKRDPRKPAQKITNVSEIVRNNEIRQKFMFCITAVGASFYSFNGMVLTKRELDILYPIEPKRFNVKGENKDGTWVG